MTLARRCALNLVSEPVITFLHALQIQLLSPPVMHYGTLSMHEVVLDLIGHLGGPSQCMCIALQPPSQPIFEGGLRKQACTCEQCPRHFLRSAGPAGRTAVQVPDRSGTGSGNESQPVRATMLYNAHCLARAKPEYDGNLP